MDNKVIYGLPGEDDDYMETVYWNGKSYSDKYHYHLGLMVRVNNDYDKYFIFRIADKSTYETLALYRINIHSPEYYKCPDIELPMMSKHEKDIMIDELVSPIDGYDMHRNAMHFNSIWEYILHDAEEYSDLPITKNPVMPNYNLLPTID